MTAVAFADSSFWVALFNPKDNLHRLAVTVLRDLGPVRLLTSEMVLAEVANLLAGYTWLRQQVGAALRGIMQDPNIEVVPQTSVQFHAALDFQLRHPDKTWSLTDCASFILMKERDITDALTHDRDFEQAGFRALLREAPAR